MGAMQVNLPARPASAREARGRVEPFLRSWPNLAVRDDALLLLSEIVTNAVRHAHGKTIVLTITTLDHRLRAEVLDESPSPPIRRASDESSGLGLVVIGQLSDRWGVDQHEGDGTTVWFEIGDSNTERS